MIPVPPSPIKSFDHSMIETFLLARELKYLRDNDGDFAVEFAYSDDVDCEITVLLMVSGSRKHVYSVMVRATKRIAKPDWGRVLMACNTWNKDKRWPKAYLSVKKDAETGTIVLEENIDLEVGIHQELFDDFSSTVMSTAFQFWRWLHREHHI